MIVVHIDTTSDGHDLIACYKDILNENVTLLINPSNSEVIEVLKSKPNETLMALGHGCRYGLFDSKLDFAIDHHTIKYLLDREVIGIWCYANQFAEMYDLHGFFTHMFVSNINEVRTYNFDYKSITEDVPHKENIIFSNKINNFIKNNIPLNEWIDNLQDYNKELDFVKFNYENLHYYPLITD